MFLHEFQSKQILSRFGIAVPAGGVAITADEARGIAERLGARSLAVKAQIRAGGRGKAGGVVLVKSAAAAEQSAREMLGRRLVTDQSGPAGRTVKRVLVEVGLEPVRTLYVSILIDPSVGEVVLAAAARGGVDIEEQILAGDAEIERAALGTGREPAPHALAGLAERLGLAGDEAEAFAQLGEKLRRAFVECDATMIEINPLAMLLDGSLMALDVKMAIDDNALFRQEGMAGWRDEEDEAELELKAPLRQINYLRMDGNVGLVANGAGLGLATLDMLCEAGGSPANFMDIRTTATSVDVAHGFALLLDNPKVRVLLINVHGGGMQACDTIAEGLGMAMRRTGRSLPTVVRLAGNNAGFARQRFSNFGCRVIDCPDMWTAAKQAAAAGR